MDLILKVLIGQSAVGCYVYSPSNSAENHGAYVVYVPTVAPTESLPPVVVATPNILNKLETQHLIKMCGNLIDKYHVEPVVLTLSIDKVQEGIARMLTETTKAPFMRKLPCHFWAQDHCVISKTILQKFLTAPLPPLAALAYVLISQEVTPLGLEHKNDATVQMLYDIKNKTIEQTSHHDELLLKVCKNSLYQYKRILGALEEDKRDTKRIRSLAIDGLCYAETYLNKYAPEDSTLNIEGDVEAGCSNNDSSKCSTPTKITTRAKGKMSDMEWAKKVTDDFKKKNGRMNWQACFDMGREAGYFSNYANVNSLKNSYNRMKMKNGL
ncbi:uncharacterized protein EV154DRAFT_569970 [Mucor mucedo]|uniref:uncharacterized protein n=1 Tax=Mucor mucedo TaxID=29922 RepID=UPI00221EEF87|nr:uncharacterized protein EV154DRAFT_569970 [Mucor mucedo]KAI7873613.1 hypothetical protein EV154DRAFT_569970 [Mucor mucedo]